MAYKSFRFSTTPGPIDKAARPYRRGKLGAAIILLPALGAFIVGGRLAEAFGPPPAASSTRDSEMYVALGCLLMAAVLLVIAHRLPRGARFLGETRRVWFAIIYGALSAGLVLGIALVVCRH